jgi:hypothetical protein
METDFTVTYSKVERKHSESAGRSKQRLFSFKCEQGILIYEKK